MNDLEKLKAKRLLLEERIIKFENELRKPLMMDSDSNALEEENRQIVNGLYRIEKVNLKMIEADINKILLSM